MSIANTTEMNNVADVFINLAYKPVIGNLVGSTLAKIQEFVIRIALQEKSYLMLTLEGLPHTISLVYDDKDHLDFILTMTNAFFARWAGDEKDIERLAENLARGVCTSNMPNKGLNGMPENIYQRLVGYDDALALLKANKWLMIVLMMPLFITVGLTTFKEKEIAQRS
jgi:hypothetical protein